MKILYTGHSGFYLETENAQYLFDYYEGVLPKIDEEKPLYVFVSHRHEDHFNPKVFQLAVSYPQIPQIKFVLAFDIRLTVKNLARWGIDETWKDRILTVRSRSCYDLSQECRIETLRSTDEGVAFLLTEKEGTIFHAGDLHWWYWEGEDKGWLGNMEANFKREVEQIAGRGIDVAFLPLDDRLENRFHMGMDWYLRKCKVQYAFPMHFWQDTSVVERFKQMDCVKDYDTIICDTVHEKEWDITLKKRKGKGELE